MLNVLAVVFFLIASITVASKVEDTLLGSISKSKDESSILSREQSYESSSLRNGSMPLDDTLDFFLINNTLSADASKANGCRRTEKGKKYRGRLSKTVSGRTCQRWSRQSPHKHGNKPSKRPRAGLELNYCRNPDNEKRPWCYTTDKKKRWEYCNVPICGDPNDCKKTKKGKEYRGKRSKTEYGKTCQQWSRQYPHKHKNTPKRKRKAGLVSNYCRNPDNSKRPWCYTTDRKKRWQYCLIPYCKAKKVAEGGDCAWTTKGKKYRGKISKTKSGRKCQEWSVNSPHKHKYKKERNPTWGLAKNYCRNPDNEKRPWCYTTDKKKRWEYCDIPRCKASIKFNPEKFNLKGLYPIKGRLLGYVTTYSNWVLKFRIKPVLKKKPWTNLVHFTANVNNGRADSRIPAVFFHPNSVKILAHIYHRDGGKANCDCGKPLSWNKVQDVRIEVYSMSFKMFIDNKMCCFWIMKRPMVPVKRTKVYVSDPWHERVGAHIWDMGYFKMKSKMYTSRMKGRFKHIAVSGDGKKVFAITKRGYSHYYAGVPSAPKKMPMSGFRHIAISGNGKVVFACTENGRLYLLVNGRRWSHVRYYKWRARSVALAYAGHLIWVNDHKNGLRFSWYGGWHKKRKYRKFHKYRWRVRSVSVAQVPGNYNIWAIGMNHRVYWRYLSSRWKDAGMHHCKYVSVSSWAMHVFAIDFWGYLWFHPGNSGSNVWRVLHGPGTTAVTASLVSKDVFFVDHAGLGYYQKGPEQDVSDASLRRIGGSAHGLSVSGKGYHVWLWFKKTVYYRGGVAGKWQLIPKVNFKEVSVSSDGSQVWALSPSGAIWFREFKKSASAQWKRVSGFLTKLTLSGDGKILWGINRKKVFCRPTSGGQWQSKGTGMIGISVSFDGKAAFGVNGQGFIFFRQGKRGWKLLWRRLYKKMKFVSVSGDVQSIWAIGRDNKVYYRDMSWSPRRQWRTINMGPNSRHLSVSSTNNVVWSVDRSFKIWIRSGVVNSVQGRFMDKIYVSRDGNHIWGISKSVLFYQDLSAKKKKWTFVKKQIKQVSASNHGIHLWAINSNGACFYCNRRKDATKWYLIQKFVGRYISVSSDGEHIWGVGRYKRAWYRNGINGKWLKQNFLKNLVQVSVVDQYNVFFLDNVGSLWYRVGIHSPRNLFLLKGVKSVSVPDVHNIWALMRKGGYLFHINGVLGHAQSTGLQFSEISGDTSGRLFCIDSSKKVFERKENCDIMKNRKFAEFHTLEGGLLKTRNVRECQNKCSDVATCFMWLYHIVTRQCSLGSKIGKSGRVLLKRHMDFNAGYRCFDPNPCPFVCRPGYYCPETCGISHCLGRYSKFSVPGTKSCRPNRVDCGLGNYCPGFFNYKPTKCRPGFYCPKKNAVKMVVCPKGFYCPDYSNKSPKKCPPRSRCLKPGLAAPSPCPLGHYCVGKKDIPCPAGYFCINGVRTICPANFFCPLKTGHPVPCAFFLKCPDKDMDLKKLSYNKWLLCSKSAAIKSNCPPGSKTPGKKNFAKLDCKKVCGRNDMSLFKKKVLKKKKIKSTVVVQTLFNKWSEKVNKKKSKVKSSGSGSSLMDVTAPKCILSKKTRKKTNLAGLQVIPVGGKNNDEFQFGNDAGIPWNNLVTRSVSSVRKRHTQLVFEFKRRKGTRIHSSNFDFNAVFRLNFRCAAEGKICHAPSKNPKGIRLVYFGIGGQYVSFQKRGNFACTAAALCKGREKQCEYYKNKRRDCYAYPLCTTCSKNIIRSLDRTGQVSVVFDQPSQKCPPGYTCFQMEAPDSVVISAKRRFSVSENQYALEIDSNKESYPYVTSSTSFFKVLTLKECDLSDFIITHPEVLDYGKKVKAMIRNPIFSTSNPDLQVTGMWVCMFADAKVKATYGKPCTGVKEGNCRPQNFKALVGQLHPREVRFQWRKGCQNSSSFQIRRTCSATPGLWTILGGSFSVKDAKCTTDIRPGNQWVDDEVKSLFSFGHKQVYCIFGTKPRTRQTCVSRLVQWNGTAAGKLVPMESDDTGISGVLVNGYLCPLRSTCSSRNPLKLGVENILLKEISQSFSTALLETHRLSFDVTTKSPVLQLNIEKIQQNCPTVTQRWDFTIIIVPSYLKIVWSKNHPLCWLVLENKGTWRRIHDIRHPKSVVGNSFDRHFDIVFSPGKKWMAKYCRQTCNLCSSCPNLIGDTTCNKWWNIDPTLCDFSGYFPDSMKKQANRYMDISDFIDQVGSIINVEKTDCDYLQSEWAYFDTYTSWRCCVNNNVVSVFDFCERHFTKCRRGNSRPVKSVRFSNLDIAVLHLYTQSASDTRDLSDQFLKLKIPLHVIKRFHGVPESSRKYSSVYGNDAIGTGHARSSLDSSAAWVAKTNKVGEWMQLDLGSEKVVSAVITQGRSKCRKWKCKEWVTSFTLQVSKDGKTFKKVQNGKVFTANVDSTSWKENVFSVPLKFRYIRFYPKSWKGRISMRADVVIMSKIYLISPEKSWCAKVNKLGQFLQVDLGAVRAVTGVVTQGSKVKNAFVRTFKLLVSNDGTSFRDAELNKKLYNGNTDKKKVLDLAFEDIVVARYFRFFPIKYNNAMCMRVNIRALVGNFYNPSEMLRKYSDVWSGYRRSILGKSYIGWIGGKGPKWMEINLGRRSPIIGVITKGNHLKKWWVTKFKLKVANSDRTYLSADDGRVFLGNINGNTRKINMLNKPVFARYIRFIPETWHGKPALRAGVLTAFDSTVKTKSINVGFKYTVSGQFEVLNAWGGEEWRFAKSVRTPPSGDFGLRFISVEKGGVYRKVRVFPLLSSEVHVDKGMVNYDHHFASSSELGSIRNEVKSELTDETHGLPLPRSRVFRVPLKGRNEYPNGKHSAVLSAGLAFYHYESKASTNWNWGDPSSLKGLLTEVKGWKLNKKNSSRTYFSTNNPGVTGTKLPFSKWVVGPANAVNHIPGAFLQIASTKELTDGSGSVGAPPNPLMIFDTTLVSIEVKLGFAYTAGHCPVADIVFCAYHDLTKKAIEGSCNATNNKGMAYIRVPFGLKVTVDYACKMGNAEVCEISDDEKPKDQLNEMEKGGKEDSKLGRDIRSVTSLGKILEKSPLINTGSKLPMLYFSDYSTHLLDLVVGFGPFHYGKPSRTFTMMMKDKRGGLDLMKVIPANSFFKGFSERVHFDIIHNSKPQCNKINIQSKRLYGVWYSSSLPYDISEEYKVRIHSTKKSGISHMLSKFFPPLLSPVSVPAGKRKRMFVLFEYRTPATVSMVVKDKNGPLTPVKACKNRLYVERTAGRKPNELEVYINAVEKYVEQKVTSKLFNGIVAASDDVAFGTKKRQARNTKATIKKGKGVFNVPCSNTGCELAYTIASSKSNAVGDAAYKITKIAYPNLQAPWAKFIETVYTNIPGFPGVRRLHVKTAIELVVLGLVPYRMHQTIKMPEYIPFAILRKPPGDGSFSQWSKNSYHSVDLHFYKSEEELAEHSLEVDLEFGAGLEPTIAAIPLVGKLLGGELSAIVGGGGTLDIENSKMSVMSYGQTVAFSSTMEISTSDSPTFAGIAGDMFLVPTLTIKVVESFTVSKDPKGGCEPKLGHVSEWLALQGDKVQLEKLLVQNREIIDPVAAHAEAKLKKATTSEDKKHYEALRLAATLLDPQTDDLAKKRKDAAYVLSHAREDKSWNSVTLHSLYHIVMIRIPQLQRQCREMNAVVTRCLKSSQYSKWFQHKDSKLIDKSWKVVCKSEKPKFVDCKKWLSANGVDMGKKPSKKNIFLGNLPQRIDITIRGINGWRKTILFNERLKKASADNGFTMKQLIASPLDSRVSSPVMHHTEPKPKNKFVEVLSKAKEWLEKFGIDFEEAATFSFGKGSKEAFIQGGKGTASNSVKGKASGLIDEKIESGLLWILGKATHLPSEDEQGDFQKSIAPLEGSNPSSVIGFSGGGSVYTYYWTAERSVPLGVHVDKYFKAEWSWEIGLQGDAEAIAETENEPENDDKEDTELWFGDSKVEDFGLSQQMSFSLSDRNDLDLFDVKITRDPVYGTPVFTTLGGRSLCPHEQKTDNTDNFKVEFVRNALDYQSGNNNFANVAVKNGAKCASAFVLIRNGAPSRNYGRFLLIENKPAGFQFNLDGVPGDYHDLVLLDGEKKERKYMVSICAFDQRVLSTKVFKDIEILVGSTCERDIGPLKIGLREAGASYNQCENGFPKPGAVHTNCVDFQDSFQIKGKGKAVNMQLFEEAPLQSRVVIKCLSFKGACGCDKTKKC